MRIHASQPASDIVPTKLRAMTRCRRRGPVVRRVADKPARRQTVDFPSESGT